ncbi:metal-sensitive transcriptional regulator [Oceanobacillus timonensis]|uniref:metal-sensitive transcriptional regulator n=1 Tax=Oceanobacillus timonensis TaxID=1926285 RepID=UPI001FE6CE93|nr:metal-sensitive transcriptional regulator [Oceanobacillus timonensis]
MGKTAEHMNPIEQKKMCCVEEGEDPNAYMPDELQRNLMNRMSRIEGQVKGVKRMIDRNVYCDDILTQMSAVQSALHSVSRLLLESHINTCVMDRLENKDPEIVEEFMTTISKMIK